MDEKASELIRTYDALLDNKRNFETLFEEVGEFILPTKVRTRQTMSPGTRRGTDRYNSTGVDAADKFASNLSATVIPRAMKWFSLSLRDKNLMTQPVKTWLGTCRDKMLEAFAASNFYQVMDEAFLDLVGFNTDAVFIGSRPTDVSGGFGGYVFEAWAIDEYVFTEDHEGMPDSGWRRFKMTADAAARKFGAMPRFTGFGRESKVTKALESDKKDRKYQRFTFLQVIRPNEAVDPLRAAINAALMPYESCYVCVDDKKVISTGGYQEKPVAISRYRKNSQDYGWGRGPGINAMADLRTLNEASRLNLKAWAKDIDPPLAVRKRGLVGDVKTSPSGITYIRQPGDIAYLESGGRYDVSRWNTDQYERAIRRHFHTDSLEMLMGDPTPNMTAFEFNKRVELMQKLLGPTLGRLEHEKLNIIIFRAFNIGLREGLFPPAPQELMGADSALDIEYVGALARAQKMDDVDSIDRAFDMGTRMAQATGDVSVLDNLDGDWALRHGAELMGVPPQAIRDKRAVEEIRAGRQQAVEEQRQMEQAAGAADIAAKAAQAAGGA